MASPLSVPACCTNGSTIAGDNDLPVLVSRVVCFPDLNAGPELDRRAMIMG